MYKVPSSEAPHGPLWTPSRPARPEEGHVDGRAGAYARAMVDEAGAGGKLTLVQEAGPLSESVIWRVQHDFYEESGVAAWGSGEVPFQVSTGPAIALSYVHMIEGLVEDCRAGRYGPVDASSPIYVLELGAG